MPDRYAVIGNPVAHSKSPWIHARFAVQTGQDIVYQPLLAPKDGFAATVEAFRAAGGRGANVTLPFKEEACAISTRLSERARAAQAVNTLIFSGSEIRGDNTDGYGLVRDLAANLGFAIAGCRILLAGAGGAARGVVLPLLAERPSALVIANRTVDKARVLAGGFAGVRACGYSDLAGEGFDLVINATSAGLSDAALPLPRGIFLAGSLAYDMVYGRDTAFMRQARADGAARAADGLGMLVEQAAESFFLWRGVRPDTAPVLSALRAG
ncbi:MAG: shikimate dehydrogenase [Proteobacteria bacterium]|nr:shikimate dehydrogenase [Pseudomonadota bacterium]